MASDSDTSRNESPKAIQLDINQPTMIVVTMDSIEMEEAKRQSGEENFYTAADDLMWYDYNLQLKLDSLNIPIIYVDNEHLQISTSLGKHTIAKDSTFFIHTYFYYDGDEINRVNVADFITQYVSTRYGDSTELTELIRAVYTWERSRKTSDYPFETHPKDTDIFTGINWTAFNQLMEEMSNTSYFTDDFINRQRKIAIRTDSSIRRAPESHRRWSDGIPEWSPEYHTWINGQDHPDEYWTYMYVSKLQPEGDSASFSWSWDTVPTPNPHEYEMTAKRIHNQWRINSIEGFRFYESMLDKMEQP